MALWLVSLFLSQKKRKRNLFGPAESVVHKGLDADS